MKVHFQIFSDDSTFIKKVETQAPFHRGMSVYLGKLGMKPRLPVFLKVKDVIYDLTTDERRVWLHADSRVDRESLLADGWWEFDPIGKYEVQSLDED